MTLVQSLEFMKAYPLRHYRLDNGLQALLLHNPISPVVTYLTHYTVGSALEHEHERGLAHFFEHMMFRETATLKDGDFERIVAESGGVGLNAFTAYDTTAYFVNIPSAHLGRLVELEADRMALLRLSPDLIEAERGAVLGEMRMYDDMPTEQFWNRLMAEAFASHPYRHPIIGYLEQVQGFKDEDFAQFYRNHYAPNRAVIVVAGGFDEPDLVRRLEQAYGGLAPGLPRPASATADPPWSDSRRVEITHDKISTDALKMAWRTPGLTHPDQPALLLLAAVLSAGQSSPLHRRIVLEGLGTYAAAASLDAEMMLASPALFMIDVGLQHGVPASRAEAAVAGLLAETGREGVAEVELERALNQMRLGMYAGLSTNGSMARQIGGATIATGEPLLLERLLAEIERVTRDDLLRVLETYVTGAPCLTVVQRPAEGKGA